MDLPILVAQWARQRRLGVCIALLCVGTALTPSRLVANPSSAFRTVLRVVSVVSAAKLAEEGAEGLTQFWRRTTSPGESIYSVTAEFERASWADFFSRPDIFLVLEYEGGRQVVVADIAYNWDYGKRIFTFRCPTMPAGTTCAIRLYDDDGALDAALKTLATRQLRWKIDGRAATPELSKVVCGTADVTATGSGDLTLIAPEHTERLVLNAPEVVAIASFTVPSAGSTDKWQMAGRFTSGGTDMGEVRLSHWYTNRLPSFTSFLLRPKAAFWGVILLGAIWLSFRLSRTSHGGRRSAEAGSPESH